MFVETTHDLENAFFSGGDAAVPARDQPRHPGRHPPLLPRLSRRSPGCEPSVYSHYQSTLDAVYVYVVPWSEFPIVPSYPHICRAMVGVPHRPLLPSLPAVSAKRFRANSKQIRPSGPDSSLVSQLETFQVVPSSLGSGWSLQCGGPDLVFAQKLTGLSKVDGFVQS